MAGELVEPAGIKDIYADDVAAVEFVGPNVRMTFYTWSGGERVVVCRLIRPRDSVGKGTIQRMVDAAASRAKADRDIGLH